MEENKQKVKLVIPQKLVLYQKEDKKLQLKQNKLLFYQNIFTIFVGVAQIITAIILAIKWR